MGSWTALTSTLNLDLALGWFCFALERLKPNGFRVHTEFAQLLFVVTDGPPRASVAASYVGVAGVLKLQMET